MEIKDYWCKSCGFLGNVSFQCPFCGSIDYSVLELKLDSLENPQEIMDIYNQGRLIVVHEDGLYKFKQAG